MTTAGHMNRDDNTYKVTVTTVTANDAMSVNSEPMGAHSDITLKAAQLATPVITFEATESDGTADANGTQSKVWACLLYTSRCV